MLLWFLGAAVLAVWYVFRDPGFDYRLLLVGAVAPDLVDVWFGGARVMHSLVASVALLAIVMLATTGRKPVRRLLLPLPIGSLLHLVLDGAWNDSEVFWWPFLGTSFDDARLPTLSRGWWSVVLEAIGLLIVVWLWRRCRLGDRATRDRFVGSGRLTPGTGPTHRSGATATR